MDTAVKQKSFVCDYCKKDFVVLKHRNKPRFCSRECFKGDLSIRNTRECPQCGTLQKFKKKCTKFCSKKCSDAALQNRLELLCATCQQPFSAIPAKVSVGRGKYCSKKCANAGREKWQSLIGKVFGNITILSFSHKDKGRTYLKCLCKCGKEFLSPSRRLGGLNRSCGCYSREYTSARNPAMMRDRLKNDDRTRWHLTYNGVTHKFRSGFEYIYAQYLISNGIAFEFEPRWFCFTSKSRYCPDFYLPETDEWIEVKGYYEKAQFAKHELFRALGHKLTVLFGPDIYPLIEGGKSLSYFYKVMHPRPPQRHQSE